VNPLSSSHSCTSCSAFCSPGGGYK
jgi:hypothetical protein